VGGESEQRATSAALWLRGSELAAGATRDARASARVSGDSEGHADRTKSRPFQNAAHESSVSKVDAEARVRW
jgi:hypothetical protein